MEIQWYRKIIRLKFDRGGEYDSTSLGKNCKYQGTIHQVTPPYSLEFDEMT